MERKANAVILMLARNSDVDNAVRSVRRLEDRFNKNFQYPWLFLNEEPFSDDFKTCVSPYPHLSLSHLRGILRAWVSRAAMLCLYPVLWVWELHCSKSASSEFHGAGRGGRHRAYTLV